MLEERLLVFYGQQQSQKSMAKKLERTLSMEQKGLQKERGCFDGGLQAVEAEREKPVQASWIVNSY